MELNIKAEMKDIYSTELKKELSILNNSFINEFNKGHKVAYLYKNIKTKDTFSFNKDICFYAASTIKILVCLYILNNDFDLEKKVLVKISDLKQDSGILKDIVKKDTKYSLKELIHLTLAESDNTAYLKLVDFVGGKKVLKEYGTSLGAKYTMQGKETDAFGLTTTCDMLIYWEEIYKFINENTPKSKLLFKYLQHPSYQIIKDDNFIRKYGMWDIAYHEVGYVNVAEPYFLFILTQLNKEEYKDRFISDAASQVKKIHECIISLDKE